jgi:hypothetical protein
MEERKTGFCSGWDRESYGYLKDAKSGEVFFCHMTELGEWQNLIVGDKVSFSVAPPYKEGKLRCAVDVRTIKGE